MDRVLVIVVLILCSTLSLSFNVPPGVQVQCQDKYRVQATVDRAVQLEVVDNKTECDRLTRTRQRKGTENVDEKPSITLVYKEKQYRANISWEFTLRGKRLPRVFLINLTFYDIVDSKNPKYMNDACVLLRLSGNRKVKNKEKVKFYFDCLPLLKEPDIGLSVQWWSYSTQGRSCRSLRSLPQQKNHCGPDVQCSQEYSFPISQNAHTYRQCACYKKLHGEPKLNWNYDYTEERFHIDFTNVPPHLEKAEIDIVDELTEESFDSITVSKLNMYNGEIHVNSTKFGSGDYTVYVCVKLKLYLECKAPEETENVYKSEIDDHCCGMGGRCDGSDYYVYSNQKLNGKIHICSTSVLRLFSRIKSKESDETKLQTILGIVGGVIVTIVVTTVTFVLCRKQKILENRSCRPPTNEIEMSEARPLRDDNQLLSRASINNERVETTFHQTQTSDHPVQQSTPVSIQNEIIYQRMGSIQTEAPVESNRYQVVLLYHPDADNPRHIQRVAELTNILTNKYEIIVERKTMANWRDFAESAFVKFPNVVLIISDGLYRVCHHYLHSEQIPETLLSERNQEIVPCIVLNTMQTLIQNDSEGQHRSSSERKDIFLHIVILDDKDDSDHLLQLFLDDYPFLKEHYHLHRFCRTDLNSEDLSPLLNDFKPRVYKGMSSDVQRKLMRFNEESASLTDTTFSC